jgi:hypothetical protein
MLRMTRMESACVNVKDDQDGVSLCQCSGICFFTATCANVWSRISEVAGIRNVWGGNVTKAICRQKCLVTPYCVGVSYDYVNAMCYLETRPPNTPTVSLSLWPGYVYFELNQAFPASCTRKYS